VVDLQRLKAAEAKAAQSASPPKSTINIQELMDEELE